tara:strand:- start:165 stop:1946 length:1782 start_codon:yes stop_codon:yes gene_type:complete
MLKKLSVFLITGLMSLTLVVGQTTLKIEWSGIPGQFEETIKADTTAAGTQAHDIYELEAGKIYLQLTELNVNSSLSIVGAAPAEEGGMPAVIQPFANAEGTSGFTNWPNGNFQVYGSGTRLFVQNVILNGASLGQEFNLGSVVTSRGDLNRVHLDNVVASHYLTFTWSTFGTSSDFLFTNSIAKAFTNGAGGQYFGGVAWGGGSWMGTIDTLVIENSTISNVIGEAIVIYSQVDHGLINHNTFANIVMNVVWYRGQNNLLIKNNLFYNTKAHAQSTYDISGWGVWHPGGAGQFKVMPDWTHKDSTVMVGPDLVDHMNRNITYHNNVWWHSQELTDFMANTEPWSWEVSATAIDTTVSGTDTTYDTTTTVTTQGDTMLALYLQTVGIDDSTKAAIAQDRGITIDGTNIKANPGIRLSSGYIKRQLARTWDFRDNLKSDTAPFDGVWWTYEPDNSYISVAWPVENKYYNMSYDKSSAAATASATGGLVGDPRWFAMTELSVDEDVIAPKTFTLEQNYPNPFNPTTTIEFSLNTASPVKLTVFDILGQEVATLVNEYKTVGSHKIQWRANTMPSGVYYYRLEADGISKTHKMVLMK